MVTGLLSRQLSSKAKLCRSIGTRLLGLVTGCSQERQVQSLGREDPLEKEMATHSSILVWKIPWTEEPGGLQSMGVAKSWTRLSD